MAKSIEDMRGLQEQTVDKTLLTDAQKENEDDLSPAEIEFLARRKAEVQQAQQAKREALVRKTLREAKPAPMTESKNDEAVTTAKFFKKAEAESQIAEVRQRIESDFLSHNKKMEQLDKLVSRLSTQDKNNYETLVELARINGERFKSYFNTQLSPKEQRGIIDVLENDEATSQYAKGLREEIIDESLVTKTLWQRVKGIFGR